MIGARWRPPLRIARRTARRTLGRTVLVSALVAAPVLGATFLDTAFRTADLSAAEKATRSLGAADGRVTVTPYERIMVFDGGGYGTPEGAEPSRDPATVRPGTLLPAGSRLLPAPRETPVRFDEGDRVTRSNAVELDTREPIVAGLYRVREGRFPAAAGEVTLSPGLAARLGAGVGDTVRTSGAPALTVVGLAGDPSCRSCLLALGLPGWTGNAITSTADGSPGTAYLLDLPDGTPADPAMRDRLAAAGVLLEPRDGYLHPEVWAIGEQVGADDTTTLAIALLVAGIGLFEVILLAGTAFAVAARRQVRDVALVLSNGGRRADVRRMLLAQGAVLGLIGGVAGVALGIGAVLAAWRGLQRLTDQDFGGLILSPRDLLVVALVGLLSGIAAAVVPAWSAAKVPVVRALSGRFGMPSAMGRKLGAGGAVVAAVGLALAALVSWRWAAARHAYGLSDGSSSGPGLGYPLVMLLGFGLAMLGLTVFAPSLVGFAGRLAGRLRLTGRLAVRDAARHRHRTGPAVGAVMVAVAGSVAVAFAVASYDQRDRDQYRATLPAGSAMVYGAGDRPREDVLAQARGAAAELPSTGQVPFTSLTAGSDRTAVYLESATPDTVGCGVPSAGADAAAVIAGPRAAQARAALAAGQAVVREDCLIRPGIARILIGEKPRDVPAVGVPPLGFSALPGGVLPDRMIRQLGLRSTLDRVFIPTSRVPTADEEDRARAYVDDQGTYFEVERGYRSAYLPGFIALIGGAGLVTLAGVAISVSLSAAEGRADLATLAAVGAPPRRRRGLAMVQAALVAGLGAGLGVLLGAAIGTTIMGGLESYPLVVPWMTVLALGVGVPALGVLVVGLVTRSRLPVVRRMA